MGVANYWEHSHLSLATFPRIGKSPRSFWLFNLQRVAIHLIPCRTISVYSCFFGPCWSKNPKTQIWLFSFSLGSQVSWEFRIIKCHLRQKNQSSKPLSWKTFPWDLIYLMILAIEPMDFSLPGCISDVKMLRCSQRIHRFSDEVPNQKKRIFPGIFYCQGDGSWGGCIRGQRW